MPRQPWSTTQFDFPVLRVPTLPNAPTREEDDIIYCLWMVASYFENEYSDREVRLKTDAPSIDDINGHLRTDELGWRPNQADLTDISAMTSSLQFSLESWTGSSPKQLFDIAQEDLQMEHPVIAFIDDLQIRRAVRESGPLHAVVIIGTDPEGEKVALADPWTGGYREFPRDKLEDAWDPMLHQIIQVKPRLTSETSEGTEE